LKNGEAKKERAQMVKKRERTKNARKTKNGYNCFDEHTQYTGPKEIENLIPLVREKWYSLIH
jgi:hypothetical protein